MLMTPDDFDSRPEWGWVKHYRYELIRGVLVVSPPPDLGERDPNEELGYLLRLYRDTHPRGNALDMTVSEQTVAVGEDRRRADRAVWVGLGRTPDPDKDFPTILVEFVSGSRRDAIRDYELKRDEYLAAGVREYWIVDRFRRVMTVYLPGMVGPTYRIVTEPQTYETELLPGFVLPLARLLSRADLWKKTRPARPRTQTKPKPPAGGNDG